MADVDASFVDGHSTVGTHGTGLGAAKRQSSSFAAYSTLGHGTAIHARVCRSKIAFSPRDKTHWAVVWRAMPGEELCGDGFCVREGKNGFLGLVVDGLGHGAFAAQAAQEAVRIFEKSTSPHVDDVVESVHQGLRATRGAAVAVTSVDQSTEVVSFSGIGNIVGSLVAAGVSQRMVSRNGTAGLVARQIQGFQYPVKEEALLRFFIRWSLQQLVIEQVSRARSMRPRTLSPRWFTETSPRSRDDALILVVRIGSWTS